MEKVRWLKGQVLIENKSLKVDNSAFLRKASQIIVYVFIFRKGKLYDFFNFEK